MATKNDERESKPVEPKENIVGRPETFPPAPAGSDPGRALPPPDQPPEAAPTKRDR